MGNRCNSRVGLLCLAELLLLLIGCVGESKGDEPPVPRTTEELEHAINTVLRETHVPGAGVVLVSKDEVRWSAGIGLADRSAGRKVTPETMFRLSGNASFIALAALKLQEEGRLRLEDPLRDLVGDVRFSNPWEDSEPLRLVHLLEHTSGFDFISLRARAATEPNVSLRDPFALYSRAITSRWRPGRFVRYSNVGYRLAGYAVDRIAGTTLDVYMHEKIFAPLDMKDASFLQTDTVQRNLAAGYCLDGVTEVHRNSRPDGVLNAPPGDLSHLVRMLLNRGTYEGIRLFDRTSIERMETPTTSAAARRGIRDGYGLGIYTISYKGFRFQRHGGVTPGFVTLYGYAADHGVGYVVMINADNFGATEQIEKLVLSYLTREWATPSPPPAAVSNEQLQTFAGYYEPYTPTFELSRFMDRLLGIKRVSNDNGVLRIRGLTGEPEYLLPAGEMGFFRSEEDSAATAAFVEEDGELFLVRTALFQGNYRHIPAWLVWGQTLVAVLCLLMMCSAVLFAIVWVPRWVLGRVRGGRQLSLRLLPLFAVVCLVAAFALVFWALANDPVGCLGKPTLLSVSYCVLTWLFAVATVAGFAQAIWAYRWEINPWIWRHSLLVSVGNVVVLGYLSYWGIIGLRFWMC